MKTYFYQKKFTLVAVVVSVLFLFWLAYRTQTTREPQEVKRETQTEQNQVDMTTEIFARWCAENPQKCHECLADPYQCEK